MLKKYLSSVTDGLKYYLENDKKITKIWFCTLVWSLCVYLKIDLQNQYFRKKEGKNSLKS